MTARKRNMAGSIAFVHRGLCTVAGSSEKNGEEEEAPTIFIPRLHQKLQKNSKPSNLKAEKNAWKGI